jgi:hypothetical protein
MKKIIPLMTVLCMAATPVLAMSDKDMDMKSDRYFNKMDTNNDGMVSMQEHDDYAKRMFTEADANRDNKLSRDELHAYKMKEKDKTMSSRGDSREYSQDQMSPSAGNAVGGSDTDKTTTGADNVDYTKGAATRGDTTRSASGAATDRSKTKY